MPANWNRTPKKTVIASCITLDLVPSGRQDILEIGANPYFMSLLLKLYRQEADCRRVNYFGGGVFGAQQSLTVSADGVRRQHTFDYVNANIESDQLPFPDGAFDVVLFCEVLEHMTSDPQRTILELKRLLRSGGQLCVDNAKCGASGKYCAPRRRREYL